MTTAGTSRGSIGATFDNSRPRPRLAALCSVDIRLQPAIEARPLDAGAGVIADDLEGLAVEVLATDGAHQDGGDVGAGNGAFAPNWVTLHDANAAATAGLVRQLARPDDGVIDTCGAHRVFPFQFPAQDVVEHRVQLVIGMGDAHRGHENELRDTGRPRGLRQRLHARVVDALRAVLRIALDV